MYMYMYMYMYITDMLHANPARNMAHNLDLASGAWQTVTTRLLASNYVDLRKHGEASTPDAVTNTAQGMRDTDVKDDIRIAYGMLTEQGMANLLEEWFMETLQQTLQKEVIPQFWSHFSLHHSPPGKLSLTEDSPLVTAINMLYTSMAPFMNSARTLSELAVETHLTKRVNYTYVKCTELVERIQTVLKAILFDHTPKCFQGLVHDFYSQAFQAFHGEKKVVGDISMSSEDDADYEEEQETIEEADDDITCMGCHNLRKECSCSGVLRCFHQINSKLHSLGLLERVCAEAITSLIHAKIKHHVENKCRGEFETSYIVKLERWLSNKVVRWLNLVFCGEESQRTIGSSTQQTLSQWKDRLQYLLYQTYANLRISELFNIIVEFPDSLCALEDLQKCLEKTDLRRHLVQSLRSSFETRLLHPGVNTDDILTQYISSIRALRVLDPSGIILELVCQPVRKYLRTREDTVRCIVSSLTDDSNKELAEELIKAEPVTMDESYCSEQEDEDHQDWQPDPIDADPGRKASDIISMLVNIYGSRELFVNEYRGLLADRILTGFNYDTARELRYLELLKLCFGESQLHHCEVMLKDVADSRRCNTHISSLKKDEEVLSEDTMKDFDFNAMILSAQFWPNLKEEKLKIPEEIEKAMEDYTKSYQVLKGMRTLNWKTNLGLVNLELELKDRRLKLSVSPVHATIIMHFQDKAKWTVDELSAVMQVSVTALRRKMAFWQSQGVLREESTDTFVLIEEQRAGRAMQHEMILLDSDEETESAMASAQDQQEEELQVFWSYIVGMLTNLESLSLDRIHSMLKMFAMQGPSASEFSEHKLRQFLDRKVREQMLVYSAGVYRLPKPET
ncbi:anaphase-promoting complex subunit 2-like [Acanthaster planci]|uniref:Anaphase-promoting complex subunit 2 n=1 Tax=Acanthaster planci TaxID=133434 RepID=A0A8B7YUA9_ACAPL|nr:anaphase-promoting complex subunit 2-like [Acanthaster planci]